MSLFIVCFHGYLVAIDTSVYVGLSGYSKAREGATVDQTRGAGVIPGAVTADNGEQPQQTSEREEHDGQWTTSDP